MIYIIYKKEFAKAAKISLQKETVEDGSSERLVESDAEIKKQEIEKFHQEQLSLIEAAGLELSHFLNKEGLSHINGKLREYGIDSLTDLDDIHILSDQILKSEVKYPSHPTHSLFFKKRKKVKKKY